MSKNDKRVVDIKYNMNSFLESKLISRGSIISFKLMKRIFFKVKKL